MQVSKNGRKKSVECEDFEYLIYIFWQINVSNILLGSSSSFKNRKIGNHTEKFGNRRWRRLACRKSKVLSAPRPSAVKLISMDVFRVQTETVTGKWLNSQKFNDLSYQTNFGLFWNIYYSKYSSVFLFWVESYINCYNHTIIQVKALWEKCFDRKNLFC